MGRDALMEICYIHPDRKKFHISSQSDSPQRSFENLFLRKDGGVGDRDSIGRPLLEPTHYLSTDVIGYR